MHVENTHIAKLVELRAELIEERRACVVMKRIETISDIATLIEAVDQSIADERKLAES